MRESLRVVLGLPVQGQRVRALQGVAVDALAGEGEEGGRVGVVVAGVVVVEVEEFVFWAGVVRLGELEEEQHGDAEGVDVEAGAGEVVGRLVAVGAEFLADFGGAVDVAVGAVGAFEMANGFVGDFVA